MQRGKYIRSNETKEKIRQSKLGIPRSDDTKKKISKNHARPMLGKIHSAESREKMRGKRNSYGRKLSEEHKTRISESLKLLTDEKSPSWKGDEVKYNGLHAWVYRKLGRPSECEICGDTEKSMYHWANKSGLYLRDTDDWIRLCVTCHSAFDRQKAQ